jgi:hypothetical protein
MLHKIYRFIQTALDPHRDIRRQAAQHNLILVHLVMEHDGWQVFDIDGRCLAIALLPETALEMAVNPRSSTSIE